MSETSGRQRIFFVSRKKSGGRRAPSADQRDRSVKNRSEEERDHRGFPKRPIRGPPAARNIGRDSGAIEEEEKGMPLVKCAVMDVNVRF
jgi:hypothetical protein